MAIPRLNPATTALLLVDMQEKLLPHIHEHQQVSDQCARLLDGANVLDVPVCVTEQYRKGLGDTVPSLGDRIGDSVGRHEKLVFSACLEPIRKELAAYGARSVLVCGIEAHVCVLQTCLDLLSVGFLPFIVTDAIGSRRPADRDAAIARMTQAGVVPTTVESALLEMVHEAGTDRFKAMLPIIK